MLLLAVLKVNTWTSMSVLSFYLYGVSRKPLEERYKGFYDDVHIASAPQASLFEQE